MDGIFKIHLSESNIFAIQICRFIAKQNYGIVLNSNQYNYKIGVNADINRYQILAAIGVKRVIEPNSNCFGELKKECSKPNQWLFGYLGYDLKNEIENLTSQNPNYSGFSSMLFFEPEWVISVVNNELTIHFDSKKHSRAMAGSLFDEILKVPRTPIAAESIQLQPRTSKSEYIELVNKVKQHIQRGDVYELNICQEFYAENVGFNPIEFYIKLNELSPTPFSGFGKFGKKYILCASPERYLSRRGTRIFSQPIKGTAPRGETPEMDEQLKVTLKNDLKERTENVMIVDLVRNDLSRIAQKGSVQVDELCEVYSFRQVNQLISTISCQLQSEFDNVDTIKATFPMGSMTGAPKIRAMELIDEYENFSRGLFSGSLGYFDPNGDFDFNVVIRSLLYNKEKKYLSLSVGGAITINSIPADEYNECMLKAKAVLELLQKK